MPYIVIALIVICILPLVPLIWFGMMDDYERHPSQLAIAILCTIVLMVVYAKLVTYGLSLIALLF